jgi:hypothetical protein
MSHPVTFPRSPILVLVVVMAVGSLLPSQGVATQATPTSDDGSTVIDFEDLPVASGGEVAAVTDQYRAQGVVFNGPTALQRPEIARSGSRVVQPCFSAEFCSAPVGMRFDAPQRRVRVWVGFSGRLDEARTVTLVGLTAGGVVEGTATVTLGPNSQPIRVEAALEVGSPSGTIRQVDVRFSPERTETNGLAVDDVEFTPAVGPGGDPFSYEIDPTIVISEPDVPGLDGGGRQPTGAMVGPDGGGDEFVLNEVVLHPDSAEELSSFLSSYGGTVLRDGTAELIPGAPHRAGLPSSGWYLIRVDLQRSALDDLKSNGSAVGLRGAFRFSSEDAARLAALVFREAPQLAVGASLLVQDDSLEHPLVASPSVPTDYLDSATWAWMIEDSDATMPGDQGLSIGVIQAWNYLRYHGLPPVGGGTWFRPTVAVIDRGFDLDQTTGAPLNGNQDYFYYGDAPLQADIVDRDGLAGGEGDGGGGEWHGQHAFGVCCAVPSNAYGGAGSGGPVVGPMLYRMDSRIYNRGYALWSAAINGADVMTISWGAYCSHLCRVGEAIVFDQGVDDHLVMGVKLAASYGAVVVASAGNDDRDLDDEDAVPGVSVTDQRVPCELDRVICVGAIDRTVACPSDPTLFGVKRDYSNWGSNVDIWAPSELYSTVAPDSADSDAGANDYGRDEVAMFGGTSAAAPFVAGVAALLKTLDQAPYPTLYWDEVQDLLRRTANPVAPSCDADVSPGYVDAYRAVARMRANQAPTIDISKPSDPSVSYARVYHFDALWQDPEPGALLPIFEAGRTVSYESDRDGFLCQATAVSADDTDLGCDIATPLSLGTHVITATGVDPFGARATDTVTVTVTNEPPIARITRPANGVTVRDNQVVRFGASIEDPDAPVDDQNVSWSSSVDGFLGTGRLPVVTSMTPGVHTITVTATDDLGLTMEDSIVVTVIPAAGFPAAEILPPAETIVSPGTSVTLQARAEDAEDGTLGGGAVAWESDDDGFLGIGSTITVVLSGPEQACDPEFVRHRITLTVTDSDGNVATDEISISVGVVC